MVEIEGDKNVNRLFQSRNVFHYSENFHIGTLLPNKVW